MESSSLAVALAPARSSQLATSPAPANTGSEVLVDVAFVMAGVATGAANMLASGLRSVDFWQPVAMTIRQQAQMTILIFVRLSIRYSAPFVGQVLEILPCSVIAEHRYDEVNHRLSSA